MMLDAVIQLKAKEISNVNFGNFFKHQYVSSSEHQAPSNPAKGGCADSNASSE